MRYFSWVMGALLLMLGAENAMAQMFSADNVSAPKPMQEAAVKAVEKTPEINKSGNEAIDKINETLAKGQTDKQNSEDSPEQQIAKALENSAKKAGGKKVDEDVAGREEDIFIPEGELHRLNTPTLDGSVRGGQAFVEVDEKGRMKKVSKIFIYYDKFEVFDYVAGSTGCNVRFNVLSNLDQKINRLDVKLVWPDLTTTLSFADVAPNTQTYYNYALLGKGCYNMDKAPNIIVNRCRVKGMTASECADKIVWLSK